MTHKQVEGVSISTREPPDLEIRVGDVWLVQKERWKSTTEITLIELTKHTVLFKEQGWENPLRYLIQNIRWIERISGDC